MVRAAICLLLLLLGGPLRAADTPPMESLAFVGVADAVEQARAGRWMSARAAAIEAGPVAEDIITWLWLRDGFGDFETARAFLDRRGDWPGLDLLRRAAEPLVPLVPRDRQQAAEVAAFFDGAPPQTGHGTGALIAAYRALGRDGDARAQAALSWVTHALSADAERVILDLYPDVVGPLADRRAERMFWAGNAQALERAAARAEGDAGALLEARLSALRGGDAAQLAADLPARLRSDAGLAHRRFRQDLARDRTDAAVTLLRQRSASAADLGDPAAWASDRRDLGRRLMRDGRARAAYELASTHWLRAGSDYADLEWLSGFIALRLLDDPARAVAHFRRFDAAVFTPISRGRAGYWLGRALAAAGEADAAQEAYAAGARWQTSFYGLLAAEQAGVPLDPALGGGATYPPLGQAGFRDSSVLEAALLLQAAGERDLAERFFTHLAETLDADDAGSLADLALSLGEPHLALRIAKAAAENGIVLPRAYYPVVDLGVDPLPVPLELALAIARRESEFDPSVSSGVGAGGLMQLMPGTARDMTRSLGIGFSRDRLYSDPSYNALLGTAYLAGLERRFGRNPVLVAAGYNAGPGRPLRWIRERGDPRDADVDVIDWIEMIPFDETRNYVMRVAELLPVYRARLGRPDPVVDLTGELKGR